MHRNFGMNMDWLLGITEDLAAVAAMKLEEEKLKEVGLKRLASIVLRVEMEKPKKVILSSWDAKVLNHKQIHYACVDAFLSFEIGKCLMIWSCLLSLETFLFAMS